jgi:hypothetical protein
MPTEIEEIFSTQAQSTWQFLIETGQGCYIPPYQRSYSWDQKNISRLFEDILHGINQITSRSDTISFIGTIIAIHDSKYQTVSPIYHPEVAPRVMTIIDGQQRICTIAMSNIVLHDYIRSTARKFEGKSESHLSWIYDESIQILDQLRNTYLIDRKTGTGNYKYYPRIIRAYSDVWSRKQDQAQYESPIAKLIWQYINFTESENTTNFDLELGESDLYKTVADAFLFIQKQIKRICQSHFERYDFPNLEEIIQAQEAFEGIWDFPLPDDVRKYVEEEISDQYYKNFCNLLRFLIFARYLNHRIAVTIVTAKNEKDAFDMFESLNTTGEPLTAFETFKPKVIEREGLSEYARSNSYNWMVEIDDYLDRYTKAREKQRATSEMLIHFALFETGTKLQKTLTFQRRYLHDEFDKLTRSEDIEKNRSFVRSLANIASFLKKMWYSENDTRLNFASHNIDDEEAFVGFEVLRELKHTITIPPLCRFYQHLLEAKDETTQIQKKDNFVAAIKATVAFSVLWRGAMGNTRNIDSHYRDIMRLGIKSGNEHVPPLARCPNGESGIVSIANYKKALQLILKNKGKIENKEDWVNLASTIAIYDHSRVLTRFLIFCASDGTVPDKNNKGLLEEGTQGINPLLTLNQWKDETYFTVEHVAPQSRDANWHQDKYDDIYNDSKTIHILGNLILLPKDENEILADRSWKHKKLMYSLLSAETVAEFNNLQPELQKVGLNLSKIANEVLNNAEYLGLCKSIALFDKEWSLEIIEERSRCLAGLAWDRLAKWLDL